MRKKIIAVIPARGGSKRIPRKNIRLFSGKPIMAWSIELALESKLFDQVVVSTDDDEIAKIALNYGAHVPFLRPQELSDDYAGTNDVIKHAVLWLQQQGEEIGDVCCLYPTSPFLRTDVLVQSYKQFKASNKDYVFSATRYAFPVERALYLNERGEIQALFSDKINERSQDLNEVYHDAGQFYWGKSKAFIEEKNLFSKNADLYILPHYLVQDIDTEDDWIRAEMMFQALNDNQ